MNLLSFAKEKVKCSPVTIRPFNPVTASPIPVLNLSEGVPRFPKELSETIVENPTSTFFVRVDTELGVPGVEQGDILVVDRTAEAGDEKIAVLVEEGQFKVRRLRRKGRRR